MTEGERRALIEDYLGGLRYALRDAPPEGRREIVEDVRGHIEEAWAASPDRSRAALLDILERLGPPEALARESGAPAPDPCPVQVVASGRTLADGCSELAARLGIVLLLLLGIGIIADIAVLAAIFAIVSAVVAAWGYRHRRSLGWGWVLFPVFFAFVFGLASYNHIGNEVGAPAESVMQEGGLPTQEATTR